MNFSDKEAYLVAIKSDMKVFLQQSFSTIYDGKEFMDNWHIDAIIYCLELSIAGEMPRLIINLPPRHLKSFIVSVVLPAFILGQDPTAKIICISYSDELAKILSRDFKRIIESEWYQKVFPNVKLSKLTESEIATQAGGFRYATSVGGTLTGRGGDFIIIDDPIKPEDTLSDKARQTTNEWYRSTLLSRLDDKKRSVLILVMQRLHVNDLSGFVEAGGGFHKLSFPAIALRDEYIPVSDTEDYLRKEGETLHEEREGIETLEMIRDEIGSFNFLSQYQQSPETPDGSFIKRKWINIIKQPPQFGPGGLLWVSIDSALSTSETADYSAISVVYSGPDGHYVIFAERGHWDYEELLSMSLIYVQRYGREVYFIVEAAGSGISLIQSLRKYGLNCFDYHPKDDKMVRASYALPIIHSGRLYIVDKEGHNEWVEPYINELVSFPHGRFDDQVDSLVQVLNWAEQRANPGGSFYIL
jgi:predicted phage terminase large subunit-like protein